MISPITKSSVSNVTAKSLYIELDQMIIKVDFDQNLNLLFIVSNEEVDFPLVDSNENEVDIIYLEESEKETPVIHKEKDNSVTKKTDPTVTVSRKFQSIFDELETKISAMKSKFVDELEKSKV